MTGRRAMSQGRARRLGQRALSGLVMCSFGLSGHASENNARAHVDTIAVCSAYEDGMEGLLDSADRLGWRPLANKDYANWERLVQEIVWIRIVSHDPYTGANGDAAAMVQMSEIISENSAAATSHIASANPNALLGDPNRRLLANELVDDAIIAVFVPGGGGASADCMAISTAQPPEDFLSHLDGLVDVPPENSLLTTATVRGVGYPETENTPRRVFIVREFDQERLAAFTDYTMSTVHTFELRIIDPELAQ